MSARSTEGPLWSKRLAIQIIVFLSIALLPIGLISVLQTRNVSAEAAERATRAIVALTEQAAFQERLLIQRALGAAQALGYSADNRLGDADACTAWVNRFAASADQYNFVALISTEGVISCATDSVARDFTSFGFLDSLLRTGARSVMLFEGGAGESPLEVIVSQPVIGPLFDLWGFVLISVPFESLFADRSFRDVPGLVGLATTTDAGRVLSAFPDRATLQGELPDADAMSTLNRQTRGILHASSTDGQKRIYAAAPVVGHDVVVVGIWEESALRAGAPNPMINPALFPLLMWIASLLVAFMAVDRLVVRHIRKLGTIMRRFARDRALPEDLGTGDLPAELAEMQRDFLGMAHGILQDEAELEDTLRSRNVLLKEVHHRVKNNLQLIASIMNIQARKSESEETRNVIRRLQDRVLSLATIHRDLYQSQDMGRVNAGHLVREIVGKNVDLAREVDEPVTLTTDIDDIHLFPDQAVPLSLLVSEAIGNATKYLAANKGGQRWITVALKKDGHDAKLTIGNSTGAVGPVDSTGMGAVLVDAFVMQLGGTKQIQSDDDRYQLNLQFKIEEFAADPVDY